MADLKLTVDYSELVAAAKTTDQTKQAIRLLGQQFSRTGDQSAYMRAVNQIVASQKNLAVNARMSRGEIMKLANQYKQTTTFADQLARAQMQLNAATQMSTKGLARSGVVMQQTGYQVGDFLVQVQSGTNAFVAFGQQATQLAGLLTMSMNPKIVALGVALSIIIPLTTAVAAYFSRTKKEADSAAEGVETLDDRLKSLDNTLTEYLRTRESLSMGITVEELLGLEGLEQVRNRLRASLKDIRDFIQAQYPGQELPNNFISQLAIESEEYRKILGEVIVAENRIATLRQRQGEEQFRTFSGRLTQYQEEIKLQQTINQFGENSEQARQVRLEQAIAAEFRRIEALRAAGELTDAQALSLQRSAEEAERLAAADIQSGVEAASIAAERLAASLGVSLDQAERMMALRGFEQGRMQGGGRGGDPRSRPGQFVVTPEIEAAYQEYLKGLRGGTEGGGGAEGLDVIERLQQEIAFRQRTLNLSKEEKALQTEIFRITNALGKDRNKYSSDFIANLAQQNLAIQEQERVIEEARQQQEQLADSIANSFGDAFMSIVDGTKSTKDAFKQMAAAIVRDLYQVYVMKRLIGSAEAGTGIAGAIGRLIGLESGGTMTANRPYIVGERGPELVIPGRSSTVTNADLTRKSMGGSDAVNVVNNINVTGGTDPAAIRMEVAKLMPTITNATKTAVIDARRRGGQMRAAFQ